MEDELNKFYENPLVTLDVDWAPDFIIEDVARKLTRENIRATWFITHKSPVLEKLFSNPLFEIGIHPNFHSQTTQGKNQDEVLENLKKIVPDAKTIRTHGLLQSTRILLKFQKYGIQNDVSLLLTKDPMLRPHFSKFLQILRLPYFWEDDIEMIEGPNWMNIEELFQIKGLKIFDFHPIHIYLNSNDMNNYNLLKKEKHIQELEKNDVEKYINKNVGTKTFFDKFVENVSRKKTLTIEELSEKNRRKI
ncbi:hypothetical protein SCCGRSA3_00302 [Marine Group I thaumarchaeote SCGC RSA3]|uniref:Polysaccharide deacetylase n=2 Tax=Marine Group I TaxID=905826 RepID=A0A087RM37_9ARCH|nr:hypothetical protein AAA799D11_01916 [Marine Group I thaumarchaeote SCGC AAA799-D11]KFM19935.1 hypothetical protein SCCGRSA3_00302 [Marine Group I thaumarchaeote SCGC RSA3]